MRKTALSGMFLGLLVLQATSIFASEVKQLTVLYSGDDLGHVEPCG